MPGCVIDHLVVTTPSLGLGAEWIRDVLGVPPQPGGEHPRMGTHNLLLRLGESSYLEIIAPNPGAPAPSRSRWFALDTLPANAAPSLAAWVVRTSDIQAAAAASSEAPGDIEAMTRGALSWSITIPSDGSLPLGGVAPALIQWHAESHPAVKLQDHGLSLERLELFHPEPARLTRLLESLAFEGPVSPMAGGSHPRLVAHFNTPHGVRSLSSPQAGP